MYLNDAICLLTSCNQHTYKPRSFPLHDPPNRRPLQLPHNTPATERPLLPHKALTNPRPQQAATSPVLHQPPRFVLAHALQPLHLDSIPLLKHAQNALVEPPKRIPLRFTRVGGFERGEGDGEGGEDGGIGLGGGG